METKEQIARWLEQAFVGERVTIGYRFRRRIYCYNKPDIDASKIRESDLHYYRATLMGCMREPFFRNGYAQHIADRLSMSHAVKSWY